MASRASSTSGVPSDDAGTPKYTRVKRRWLQEFVRELQDVKAMPAFRLVKAVEATGDDWDDELQVLQQDLDDAMTDLPRHVASRLQQMQHLTTGMTTTMGAALDTDGHYTRTQVDNMLQRLKAAEAGHGREEGGVEEAGTDHTFLLGEINKMHAAATVIQRAFRAFKARCLVTGWPSQLDPRLVHMRHAAKARYLEGIARHGGRKGEIARAKVAVLRGKAMSAAEAVASKFEAEAQRRAKDGILRAPVSGASSGYQLHDREYRVMMLGKDFVEAEEKRLQREEEERRRQEEERKQREAWEEEERQRREEERCARDVRGRKREDERRRRLEDEYRDKVRMGLMGMNLGEGAEGSHAYQRGTRHYKESGQELQAKLEAMAKAGLMSGEEMIRQAMFGDDIARDGIVSAIIGASSQQDVQAVIREQVQRMAQVLIQAQQAEAARQVQASEQVRRDKELLQQQAAMAMALAHSSVPEIRTRDWGTARGIGGTTIRRRGPSAEPGAGPEGVTSVANLVDEVEAVVAAAAALAAANGGGAGFAGFGPGSASWFSPSQSPFGGRALAHMASVASIGSGGSPSGGSGGDPSPCEEGAVRQSWAIADAGGRAVALRATMRRLAREAVAEQLPGWAPGLGRASEGEAGKGDTSMEEWIARAFGLQTGSVSQESEQAGPSSGSSPQPSSNPPSHLSLGQDGTFDPTSYPSVSAALAAAAAKPLPAYLAKAIAANSFWARGSAPESPPPQQGGTQAPPAGEGFTPPYPGAQTGASWYEGSPSSGQQAGPLPRRTSPGPTLEPGQPPWGDQQEGSGAAAAGSSSGGGPSAAGREQLMPPRSPLRPTIKVHVQNQEAPLPAVGSPHASSSPGRMPSPPGGRAVKVLTFESAADSSKFESPVTPGFALEGPSPFGASDVAYLDSVPSPRGPSASPSALNPSLGPGGPPASPKAAPLAVGDQQAPPLIPVHLQGLQRLQLKLLGAYSRPGSSPNSPMASRHRTPAKGGRGPGAGGEAGATGESGGGGRGPSVYSSLDMSRLAQPEFESAAAGVAYPLAGTDVEGGLVTRRSGSEPDLWRRLPANSCAAPSSNFGAQRSASPGPGLYLPPGQGQGQAHAAGGLSHRPSGNAASAPLPQLSHRAAYASFTQGADPSYRGSIPSSNAAAPGTAGPPVPPGPRNYPGASAAASSLSPQGRPLAVPPSASPALPGRSSPAPSSPYNSAAFHQAWLAAQGLPPSTPSHPHPPSQHPHSPQHHHPHHHHTHHAHHTLSHLHLQSAYTHSPHQHAPGPPSSAPASAAALAAAQAASASSHRKSESRMFRARRLSPVADTYAAPMPAAGVGAQARPGRPAWNDDERIGATGSAAPSASKPSATRGVAGGGPGVPGARARRSSGLSAQILDVLAEDGPWKEIFQAERRQAQELEAR